MAVMKYESLSLFLFPEEILLDIRLIFPSNKISIFESENGFTLVKEKCLLFSKYIAVPLYLLSAFRNFTISSVLNSKLSDSITNTLFPLGLDLQSITLYLSKTSSIPFRIFIWDEFIFCLRGLPWFDS